jgi:hypothetical protein
MVFEHVRYALTQFLTCLQHLGCISRRSPRADDLAAH